MEEREQYVNGVRIHYRISGSGPALVLLHGSPQTSFAWRKLIPLLAANYTVIAPDLRGHGQSEKPAVGYEAHAMAEDVRQLVTQLGFQHVSIVGHDLGGIVAYIYAAQHMNEVRRLGIIEAPILGVPSPTMEKVLASYWHLGLYAHPTLPELLLAGRERAYLAEFIRTYQYLDGVDDEALDEYARHLASPGGIRGVMGVYRSIGNEVPKTAQLTTKKLTMPVWAVGGDHSMGMGPFEQFQQLADTVHGGVISDCGHWPSEEQPAQLGAALAEFLR